MSKREDIKTKKDDIIDYWIERVNECGLSVDWAEAGERCWRCGCESSLHRAHIVPDALGGKDTPSNLVLLCPRCHAEAPNVDDSEIMWDWIKAYGVPFYDTFWQIAGRKEYEFIYGTSMMDKLKEIFDKAGISLKDERVKKLIEDGFCQAMDKSSTHFGQWYLNTATVAGNYRIMLKHIAKELGVEFPVVQKEEFVKPWWAPYLGFK